MQDTISVDNSVYAREPLCVRRDIPVFSETSEYVENYEKISQDHLAEMEKTGNNPWIGETLWVELENSTVQLIEKYSQPGDKILDVGVGLGRVMSHFPKLEKYGMDISLEYLELARKNDINVCYSLVEDMPYKEETFDLVVATDVLEHVLDLNLSLRKMLAVLKPGGVLIVRVPYREDLEVYNDPTLPYKFIHLRNFDDASLKLLFERIFDCEWLESLTAGHYLQHPNRFKYRLPRGEMKFFLMIQKFKDSYPNFYQKLMKKLVLPIDINLAVRKK
jgi:ubiquinone/menaquinone biosynthesis C-methylase UbiE